MQSETLFGMPSKAIGQQPIPYRREIVGALVDDVIINEWGTTLVGAVARTGIHRSAWQRVRAGTKVSALTLRKIETATGLPRGLLGAILAEQWELVDGMRLTHAQHQIIDLGRRGRLRRAR